MFNQREENTQEEDLQDRTDLRNQPENELVEIVFDINFYSDFFLSLQLKQNLIAVLRAMYVFTDAQLTCLKNHVEYYKLLRDKNNESVEAQESKSEDADKIDLRSGADNALTKWVFDKEYAMDEEDFFWYRKFNRNLIPLVQALFLFTDAQLACLQKRVIDEKEKAARYNASLKNHSSQKPDEGKIQPVTAPKSPKNLMEDQDFIAISKSVDIQVAAEAQPLIDKIEEYLSTLSGKTKEDHATYILKELQGLQFDPTCDKLHDPVVYERVADQIEKHANSKFGLSLKTKFGLFTESKDASILRIIFKDTFPALLKKSVSDEKAEKKADDSSNPEPISPRISI
jgi:hypothetical protein